MRVFDHMLFSFGKKFTDMWAAAFKAKELDHGGDGFGGLRAMWALKLAHLSPQEIKRGVDALSRQQYCPTLPEFIGLCRPPIDPLAAYYEAVEGVTARERGETGEWSHPAIFWATVAVGAHDLKGSTYSHIRQRWETALQAEIDKGAWADIPKPMIALPAPSRRELDKQVAARVLSGLKDLTPTGKSDHKAWAKRILQRVANGEKLPLVSVQMAKDAIQARETV